MNETWKAVVGWEGDYEVSDLGRVRGVSRVVGDRRKMLVKGQVLVPHVAGGSCSTKRYLGVLLYRNGKRLCVFIHRLVLDAFFGPCPDGMEACHNDGDRCNNSVGNLRWDTRSNNSKDKVRHGTMLVGEHHPHSRLKACEVLAIRKWHKAGVAQRAIGRMFKMHSAKINDIVHRRTWKCLP